MGGGLHTVRCMYLRLTIADHYLLVFVVSQVAHFWFGGEERNGCVMSFWSKIKLEQVGCNVRGLSLLCY